MLQLIIVNGNQVCVCVHVVFWGRLGGLTQVSISLHAGRKQFVCWLVHSECVCVCVRSLVVSSGPINKTFYPPKLKQDSEEDMV